MAEGAVMAPSAYNALLFNLKVASGIYSKENVDCFCGSSNYRQITQKDRYGIDYSLCLCVDCGLLYSNPRMTEESFEQFYRDDYRMIYSDRMEIGTYTDEQKGSSRIKDMVYDTLKEFELPMPKIVFEIGCGTGSSLVPFKKDCDCIGVDYDADAINKGRDLGLDLRHGGIDILEATGKQADLIIMSHVLEHMTDIERELKRIRNLLNDKGVLYVAVPGFYVYNKSAMFQNAHNYQFTGNTLSYVMRCCGFSEFILDEQIESLWHKSDFMTKENKYKDEYRTIETFLTEERFLLPNIRMNCKFGLTDRRNNIKYAVTTGMPEISNLIGKQPDSEAVIVSGGPTIDSYPEKIKELQARGCRIYAIERMYKWCLNHGITPDYVIALDASDDVIESFYEISPDVTHLVVGHAPNVVFDKLKDYKAYYFLLMQKGIDYSQIYTDGKHHDITFINSGSSVTLCCMSIAMSFGAKNLHIFGFDCHLGEKNYADGITGVGCINDIMEIDIDERTFKTTSSYFGFMQQFFQLYLAGQSNGLLENVKIYGDSMVKTASKIDLDGDKADG
jgi:SAM-dependent methyltransferase